LAENTSYIDDQNKSDSLSNAYQSKLTVTIASNFAHTDSKDKMQPFEQLLLVFITKYCLCILLSLVLPCYQTLLNCLKIFGFQSTKLYLLAYFFVAIIKPLESLQPSTNK